MRRPLVVAAHGTASVQGRDVVEACAAAAAAELDVAHAVGYVDVCGPPLQQVLEQQVVQQQVLEGTPPPVVVPLFLARGYHVRHDVPAAVRSSPGAVVTPALGTAPEVVTALADRVLEAAEPDAVVVTAAGSSVAGARAEVAEVAQLLAARLAVPTGTAYLTGPGPRPREEVERLRAAGHERVVLAAHLLAPGHFHDRASALASALGTVASGPLSTHPAVVSLLVRRYRDAALLI